MKKISSILIILTAFVLCTSPVNARVGANSGDLTAANQTVVLSVDDCGAATFQLTNTFTATVTFEAATRDGTWIAIPAVNVNTDARATTASATGIYQVSGSGFNQVRARVSAYTSGTVTVNAQCGGGSALISQAANAVQSGTWTVQPGNTANTTAWKVDGSAVTQPVQITDQTINGALSSTGAVTLTNLVGIGTAGIQITGVFVGTLQFEGTVDGTNWFSLNAVPLPSGTVTTSTTTTGQWQVDIAAVTQFRVRMSAYTSGTATIYLRGGQATAVTAIALDAPIPSGTNIIGKVTTDQTTHGTTDLVADDIVKINGTTIVTGGVAGSQSVGGPTASGASLTANPLTLGGRAATTNPTAVADGQVVNAAFDKLGKQITVPGCPRELIVKSGVITLTTTTETTLFSSVASTFLDIYALSCSNTSATAVRVDVRDSTAGTIQYPLYVPAGDIRGLTTGIIIPQTTAANNWTIQLSGAVTDVRCVAFACKNP